MDQKRRGFLTGSVSTGFLLGAFTGFAGLGSLLRSSWAAAATKSAGLAEIARTASDCIRTGEACAAHCQRELAQGHTAMADCDRKVHEMLSLTRAMLALAASGSAYAARLAPLCADACKACADACAQHREHFSHGMHLECKECMEACEACVKACHAI